MAMCNKGNYNSQYTYEYDISDRIIFALYWND